MGCSTRKDAAFTKMCKAKRRWRMVTPISLLPLCHHHYQLLGGLWMYKIFPRISQGQKESLLHKISKPPLLLFVFP